ncbi:MAG: hypothetical protein ABH851_02120 [Methanobacteriota archaeon]
MIFFAGTVNAANQTKTDTISITVTVNEKTLIDISPTSLNWSYMDPGSFGVEQGIVIENVGSTNVSYIWFNTTYPTSRPFGTGSNNSYNAGNYVRIRQNLSATNYYFIDRWEYNETPLIYLTEPAGYETQGRLRVGDAEYFWYAANDGTQCNSTTATFYLGETAHNQTQSGTIDLSGCSDTLTAGDTDCRTGVFEGEDSGWGWADVVVGTVAGSVNYSVAVSEDCTTARFYKWNMDAPGATAATNTFADYFADTSSVLTPGETRVANIAVAVPFGVHAGPQMPGTVTVIAVAIDVTG